MDADNCNVAETLISKTYIQQGSQALAARRRLIKTLLSQRRLPQRGWDDATIELLIQDAALMDSNNFLDNVGLGEREARVASGMVARRHFRLAHGIGRSGDIAAEQPKAAGSSLLASLTHLLAADALQLAGMHEVGKALVVPLATGMALTATLLALRGMRPPTARYVLWPRIDQKTCLKAVQASGYEPVVVPMRLEGDELVTDVEALQQQVARLGAEAIACILTTTSCFAPRAADDVVAVAKLCQQAGVAHIINNAYGVQSAVLCAQVCSAWRKGRVDAVVQSTDKNFMVPVGGAVIAARRGATQLVERVASMYPGRACMAPLLDLLITLLHWGAAGWQAVLQRREQLYCHAAVLLRGWAEEHGERLLDTPGNPISLALSLATLGQPAGACEQQQMPAEQAVEGTASHHASPQQESQQESQQQQPHQQQQVPITFLGSMLFGRGVSGTRVVARCRRQSVGGVDFLGYGAHCDNYPCDYLTVAAALGTTEADVQDFLLRLTRCAVEFHQRQRRLAAQAGG
ncbi:hypothetical protein D9Q98_006179 [Chlorella vulgaris]|uniref:O-phosphoseryl-tRNA(Sec) selenium transferase n=1 Tax=Chlorella vulgaris TaxID=3077 RepID=A0A9D4TX52_CHLVU|nr:hypothetical protein D9Q98_006179 [Chlorella vulgaris]